MADAINELLVTDIAAEKLGGRDISDEEAEQLLRNANVTARNPSTGGERERLLLLIGRTDGGRTLTPVGRADDRADELAGHHRLDGD